MDTPQTELTRVPAFSELIYHRSGGNARQIWMSVQEPPEWVTSRPRPGDPSNSTLTTRSSALTARVGSCIVPLVRHDGRLSPMVRRESARLVGFIAAIERSVWPLLHSGKTARSAEPRPRAAALRTIAFQLTFWRLH